MKRRFPKFLIGAVALLSMTALTACGGGKGTQGNKPVDGKETQSAGAEQAEGKGGLKVAIVSSPSGVDDGNFNQEVYSGLLSFKESHPDATINAIKEESGAPDAAVQAVADIVADYDVIVGSGYQFAGMSKIAEENPEKKFILVDSFPTDAEGKEKEVENIYAMTFAEQESGFFGGIAAALETKTGKVAVVNGIAFPTNVNYQYGFESGVAYANKHFKAKAECVSLPSYAGTDVTGKNVGGNYVGDFADEATGKVVGKALIDSGVDVIFTAAGGSGNGVFTAVKEATDVKVIGCDVDQFADGVNGDKNIVLTSVLKVIGKNVDEQLNLIADGKFKGANELLTASTDSTGFVTTDHQQTSDETMKSMKEVYEKVKSGEIVPPSNFSDSTVDNFPGL